MRTDASKRLRQLVVVAVFAAMAYVVMILIHFPVAFLTLDVKDAVITLCGLFFGPAAAALLAVLVPVLELVTVSDTGVYGLLMNMIGSLAFALPASIIYRYRKTFWGAIAGLLSSVFGMTAVMMIANLIVTPHYTGMAASAVAGMIPTLLLPFNAVKAVLNAALVLLLYKPLSNILHRSDFLTRANAPEHPAAAPSPARSIAVTAVAVVLIAASLLVVFLVLGGKFTFGVGK